MAAHDQFKKKRMVWIWHRRAGKDKTALNFTIKEMFARVGIYYHLFPTLNQGRKIMWDGIDANGFRTRDHFPKEIIKSTNDQEMQVELTNGSVWQIIGTDKTLANIVGPNPVGCVFSEYALQNPTAWELIRPILRENGGWAIFDFTPRGKNHGWDLYQMARNNPAWDCQAPLTIEMTLRDSPKENGKPVLTLEDIAEERREGMPEELIQQEYYCSFEGHNVGTYYGPQLEQATSDNRITRIPWETTLDVHTAWDLGVGDATAIWFIQVHGREVRLIDYYENSGEGLEHYIKIIREKPYVYRTHWAPHDIEVKEFGTGKTRFEMALSLGIRFKVLPKLGLDDGIASTRQLFPRCYFDREKCKAGLAALAQYHKEYDDKRKQFRDIPDHDWSTHGADAFRYLSMGLKHLTMATTSKLQVKTEYNPFARERA